MARRLYTTRLRCAHPGCSETSFYEHTTRREQQDSERRLRERPWRCTRHTRPDEVLSVENTERETVLVNEQREYGRFFGSNGFVYGPGFRAFAADFPAGSRLIVTARIEVPVTTASKEKP